MWINIAHFCVPGEGPLVCARELHGCWAEHPKGPTFSSLVFFTGSEYRGLRLPRLNTCRFCFALLSCSSFSCQCAMFRWQWSVTNCPPSMLLSSVKPLVSWSSSTKMALAWFCPPKLMEKEIVCLFVFSSQVSCISSQSNLPLSGNEALIICVLAGDLLRFF